MKADIPHQHSNAGKLQFLAGCSSSQSEDTAPQLCNPTPNSVCGSPLLKTQSRFLFTLRLHELWPCFQIPNTLTAFWKCLTVNTQWVFLANFIVTKLQTTWKWKQVKTNCKHAISVKNPFLIIWTHFWDVCQSLVSNLCPSLPMWDYKYEKDVRAYWRQKNVEIKITFCLSSYAVFAICVCYWLYEIFWTF